MTRRRVEADIEQFRGLAQEADIKEVAVPPGRKDVEIAWTDSDGFHIEEGVAVGVYFDPGRLETETVHIDWEDERDRTSAKWENVSTLIESEYYFPNE